jgi:hypothetical protein
MTKGTDFQYAPFNGAESDEIRILRQNPQYSDFVTFPRHHIAHIEKR